MPPEQPTIPEQQPVFQDPDTLTPDVNRLLLQACSIQRAEDVELLLNAGADPNTKDKVNNTPLINVLKPVPKNEENVMRIVSMLLKKGADVNAKNKVGETPLSCALTGHSPNVVVMLIKAGARTNDGGINPLFSAVETLNADIFDTLVRAGVSVSQEDPEGRNLLLYTVWKRPLVSADFIEHLIDMGVDMHAIDNTGRNALHWVASAGNLSAVAFLVEAGIDINRKNKNGDTPLSCAEKEASFSEHYADVIQFLKSHGATR